jgi:hypothetical protein
VAVDAWARHADDEGSEWLSSARDQFGRLFVQHFVVKSLCRQRMETSKSRTLSAEPIGLKVEGEGEEGKR